MPAIPTPMVPIQSKPDQPKKVKSNYLVPILIGAAAILAFLLVINYAI